MGRAEKKRGFFLLLTALDLLLNKCVKVFLARNGKASCVGRWPAMIPERAERRAPIKSGPSVRHLSACRLEWMWRHRYG